MIKKITISSTVFIEKNTELTNHIFLLEKFIEWNKSFLINNYKYLKNNKWSVAIGDSDNIEIPHDILPMQLDNFESNNKLFSVSELVDNLKIYFEGWKVLNKFNNLRFITQINCKNLNVNLDKLLINQLLISIFSNMLTFINSATASYSIKIEFDSESIIYTTDSFMIPFELLLKHSEGILFYSGNIFILNFLQIFVLLDQNNIAYEIKNIEPSTTKLIIKFNNNKNRVITKKDDKLQRIDNVIKFDDFKK